MKITIKEIGTTFTKLCSAWEGSREDNICAGILAELPTSLEPAPLSDLLPYA